MTAADSDPEALQMPLIHMHLGWRVVLWLVTSLLSGVAAVYLFGVAWMAHRNGFEGIHFWQASWAAYLYFIGWVMLSPFGAVILAGWAIVDRRARSIEQSWSSIMVGLLFVAFPSMLLISWIGGSSFFEGLGLGTCQWLALLLPRLVVPGLGRGCFRKPRIEVTP